MSVDILACGGARMALEHSQSHPRMLMSNATSHVWAFGAVAELVDNAQDEDAQASHISISGRHDVPGGMLAVDDDGSGMARGDLLRMLSFGYSEKEHFSNSIGRFGIGFKSGSMRLGDDALVFTRQLGTASVALLSQTFLAATTAKEILIPMLTWAVQPDGTLQALHPEDPGDWSRSMAVITQYSQYKSEEEVVRQLPSKGTHIVIYNLRRSELDFASDPNDIRLHGPDGQPFRQDREDQQVSEMYEEDYSLRAYLSILFLRPRIKITVQGKVVQPRDPIARLMIQRKEFKPRSFSGTPGPGGRLDPVKLWLGYNDTQEYAKKHGLHIYNKNRLIRMYAKFGEQRQYNCMMKDMLGVVEADCLVPTHNKQSFQTADHVYHKFDQHIRKCMKEYYYNFQTHRTAGMANRKRKAQSQHGDSDSEGTREDLVKEEEMEDHKLPQVAVAAAATAGPSGGRRLASLAAVHTIAQLAALGAASTSGASRPKPRKHTGSGGAAGATAGPSSSTPRDWRTLSRTLLDKLERHKAKYVAAFFEPVDPNDAPGYDEIITHPMDFGTIRHRLAGTGPATGHQYEFVSEFQSDCQLVFTNAFSYNQPNTWPWDTARSLESAFLKAWADLEAKLPQEQQQTRAATLVQARHAPAAELRAQPAGATPNRRGAPAGALTVQPACAPTPRATPDPGVPTRIAAHDDMAMDASEVEEQEQREDPASLHPCEVTPECSDEEGVSGAEGSQRAREWRQGGSAQTTRRAPATAAAGQHAAARQGSGSPPKPAGQAHAAASEVNELGKHTGLKRHSPVGGDAHDTHASDDEVNELGKHTVRKRHSPVGGDAHDTHASDDDDEAAAAERPGPSKRTTHESHAPAAAPTPRRHAASRAASPGVHDTEPRPQGQDHTAPTGRAQEQPGQPSSVIASSSTSASGLAADLHERGSEAGPATVAELRKALAQSRLQREAEQAAAEHLRDQLNAQLEALQEENQRLRAQGRKDQAQINQLSSDTKRLQFLLDHQNAPHSSR